MSKHMIDEDNGTKSLEGQIKEAGRKVLYGTMSLILASSLVPVPPQSAFASDTDVPNAEEQKNKGAEAPSPETPSTDAPSTDAPSSDTPSTDQTPANDDPQNTPDGVQSPDGGTTGDGNANEGNGATKGESPSGDGANPTNQDGQASTGGEGTDNPNSSNTNASTTDETADKGGDAQKGESKTGEEQPKEQPKEQAKEPEKEPAKEPETTDPSGDQPSDDPVMQAQGAEDAKGDGDTQQEQEVELSVKAVANDEGVGSAEVNNVKYYGKGVKVTFTFDGVEDGASLDFTSATVNGIANGGGDTENVISIDDKSLTLTLNETGEYQEFTISGVKCKQGETEKTVKECTATLDLAINVDAVAPAIKSIKLYKGDSEVADITKVTESPLVSQGTKLEIVAEDVTSGLSDGSSVVVVGLADDPIEFSKGSAEVTNLSDGPLGFKVVVKDKVGNEDSRLVGAVEEEGTLKTNDSLILDNVAPEIASAEISNETVSETNTAEKTYKGQGIRLSYDPVEEHFDSDKSTVTFEKTGDSPTSTKLHWNDGIVSDNASYFPMEAGTYTITVKLVDLAGNVGHDITYSNVVLEASPTAITDTSSDSVKAFLKDDNNRYLVSPAGEITFTRTGNAADTTVELHAKKAGSDQAFEITEPTTWASDGESGTFTKKVPLTDTGVYTFWLTGGDGDQAADPNDVWTVEVDAQAPQVNAGTGITISGEPVDVNGTQVYKASAGADAVSATITVHESYLNKGEGGTSISVKKKDSSSNEYVEADSGDYTLSEWSSGSDGKNTRTVTFNKGGMYQIEVVGGKDLLGNEDQSQKVTKELEVDTKAPDVEHISILENDGEEISLGDEKSAYKKKGDDPVKATVVVSEAHFMPYDEQSESAKSGTKVVCKAPDGTETTVASSAWTDGDPGTKKCVVELPDDGDYTITVTPGSDALGNNGAAEKSETFSIDNTAPKITGSLTEDGTKLAVSGENPDGNLYKKKGGQDVSVTVEVDEANFLEWAQDQDADNGGTRVVVRAGGKDYTLVTEGDETQLVYLEAPAGAEGRVLEGVTASAWAEEGGKHSAKLTFSQDGAYKVTAYAGKDQLGNLDEPPVSKETETFVVDNAKPTVQSISILSTDGTQTNLGDGQVTYKRAGDGPVKATVVVSEAHFMPYDEQSAPDGTKVVYVAPGETDPVVASVVWEDGDEPGTKKCVVELPDDGDYTITVTPGSDKLGNDGAKEESKTFNIDNTAPDITGSLTEDGTKLAVSGENPDGNLYKKKDGQDVSVTVVVDEAHFLEWAQDQDTDNGGTRVVVTDGDGADSKELQPGTGYEDSGWQHDGRTHTKTLTFPNDGTYMVTAYAGQDLPKNPSKEAVTTGVFDVDNNPPQIRKTGFVGTATGKRTAEGVDLWTPNESGSLQFTATLYDAHFLAWNGKSGKDDSNGGSHVLVEHRAFGSAETGWSQYQTWKPSNDGEADCVLDLNEDGLYRITVVAGKDRLGYESDKTEIITIARDATSPSVPQIEIGRAPDGQDANGRDFYNNQPVTATVTLSDWNIDESATLVNGLTLSEIRNGRQAVGTRRTQVQDVPSENGNPPKVIVTMDCDPGVRELSAKTVDKSGLSSEAAVPEFVVDDEAPMLVAAYANQTPAFFGSNDLGTYYFFRVDKAGDSTTAYVRVAGEPYGLRSVTLQRGGQSSSLNFTSMGNGEYEIPITTLATDGDEFTDEYVLTVTDYAGNYTTWSMKKDGTFKGRDVKTGSEHAKLQYPALNGGSDLGHPHILLADGVAPAVTLAGGLGDTKYPVTNQPIGFSLGITERYFGYLQQADPTRGVLYVDFTDEGKSATTTRSIVATQATVQGSYFEYNETLTPNFDDHSLDGDYFIHGQFADLVGHQSNPVELSRFTIDTRAPEATVSFNDDGFRKVHVDETGYTYINTNGGTRVATVVVTERNFTADDLNAQDDLVNVSVTLDQRSQNVAVPVRSAWEAVPGTADQFFCTVSFPEDGLYTIRVAGADKAGNQVHVHDYEDTFIIDNTNPEISTDYEELGAANDYRLLDGDGRRYYAHPIRVKTTVRDRNFDPAQVVFTGPDGTENVLGTSLDGWTYEGVDEDGIHTYTREVQITETNGNRFTPYVRVTDRTANTSEFGAVALIIDQTEPEISVTVDRTPTSTATPAGQDDPIQFFNQATTMTFSFSDIHLIRRVALVDPDNEYVINSSESNIAEGSPSGVVQIGLRDGTQSANDTVYERPIYFMVEDIAGNQRTWTIDRQGNVIKDSLTAASDNTSINGQNIYPLALIQDTTNPTVTLSGVTAGQYYNTPQVVHAQVDEFNFDYLQQYAGSRPIVFVTKYEGNASRAMSSWEVPASQFSGSRPDYGFDQEFAGDGHYVVRAQFDDYANNPSNVAEIGEFTIDRTPPTITVTWDNNDARNGNHYRANRTATITVVEHNFNPADFTINAPGGVIGGWSSDGDTHTCIVTYTTDGTCSLSVSGKDMAGNEATTFTEPQFIVDKTMPKVSFKGTVQRYGMTEAGSSQRKNAYDQDIADDGEKPEGREGEQVGIEKSDVLQDHHAYNGEVSPVIVFRDDNAGDGTANYDPNGVTYKVTDGAGNDVTERFRSLETHGGITGEGNGEEYSFGNLGVLNGNDGLPMSDGNDHGDGQVHYVYDPNMDGIYTFHASMTDLAGNQAENDITFSVNRYGSTYTVEVLDVSDGTEKPIQTDQNATGLNYHILASSPRIRVHEVNVSGSDSSDDHQVRKEYANVTSAIKAMSDDEAKRQATGESQPAGFGLRQMANSEAAQNGWTEYVYTIREGNFGIGSDSDHADGGQGDYRVNVYSIDRATNDVGTDNYLQRAALQGGSGRQMRGERDVIDAARRNAQVSFRLDEIGPAIEDAHLPNILQVGATYEASFYVNDVITEGDTVNIVMDGDQLQGVSQQTLDEEGRELQQGEYLMPDTTDGTGQYKFIINASAMPFTTHNVAVSVTDRREGYEGHEAAILPFRTFMVTTLIPEIAVVLLVAGGITGGVVLYRRRKDLAEPETPGSYE